MSRYSKYMLCFFMLMVTFSILCWMGDGGFLGYGLVEAKIAQNPVIFDKANPNIQAVIAVQNRHTPGLMANPDVVGTGVGLTKDGEPAIVVYTLYPTKTIPPVIENLPVIIEVTGMFVALVDDCDPTAWFPLPVPIGVSTGHPDITAGTIGCRVKDKDGNLYALSNNHVYANCNDASIGDNVLQPGPYDGGMDPSDAIGTLYGFEPILFDGTDNTIDAAIALSSADELDCSTCSDGYGIPNSETQPASIDLDVQKCGRTTGCTNGVVSAISVTVNVCYKPAGPFRCQKLARFVDQTTITPETFSAGGDSGSLIVTKENKKPVGLLFAGSSTLTLANPIDPVLSRFGVTVDDKCGGNIPLTANFTYTTSELTAIFTNTSVDSDSSIVSWNWNFGDGSISTEQHPIHTYAVSGTYTVTLTVTGDYGVSDSVSKNVTVTLSSEISLTAKGYKVKGSQKVDLEWSGATSADIDIYRDGGKIATTDNNGFYTDNVDKKGGGSYIYKICEKDTSSCSNEAAVTF